MRDSRQRLAKGAEKKTEHWINAAAAACLCIVIALAPLPFGSTDSKVIAVWVLLLSVTVGLASVRPFTSRDVRFLFGFGAIALIWVVLVIEQASQVPVSAGRAMDPIWQQTGTILNQDVGRSASLVRYQPYFAAGAEIACMLSMVGGFLVGRNRKNAHHVLRTFAWSGLAYAVYGIAAFVFWPDYLLWQQKSGYEKSLIATFTNPNVAAVYLGTCTVAWLLMLAKEIDLPVAGPRLRWTGLADTLLAHPTRWTIVCFSCSFVTGSAMFMTGSRAGSVLSLLAISGAAATLYRRQFGIRGLLLTFPISALCTIVIVLQIFAGRIDRKFGLEGFFDSGRWNTYFSTVKIIAEHPWLGTGLGSFRWVFPRYRDSENSMAGIWAQAHSTTIETACEMGIPFALLLAVAWLLIFVVLAKGALTRDRDQILPLAAFWVGVIAIAHSQIDFSLQIPGFAVPVCALVGMGMAQAVSSRA